jgi:hypothetical protein
MSAPQADDRPPRPTSGRHTVRTRRRQTQRPIDARRLRRRPAGRGLRSGTRGPAEGEMRRGDMVIQVALCDSLHLDKLDVGSRS